MCPKNSKTPLFLIGGIGFVIILVAICGITLINNINLSNIIRLNEKVASDSMSTNNQPNQQYDDDDDGGSDDDNNNFQGNERLADYAQSHPKNIYRIDKETGMMTEHHHHHQQQQLNATTNAARHLQPEHKPNEMSSSASLFTSASSSSLGLWPAAKILDNDRIVDTLQIQEVNAISMDHTTKNPTRETTTLHGLNKTLLTAAREANTLTASANISVSDLSTTSASTNVKKDNNSNNNNNVLNPYVDTTTTEATTTTTSSPFLVISDKNTSMIDYEKRSHVVKVSWKLSSPL